MSEARFSAGWRWPAAVWARQLLVRALLAAQEAPAFPPTPLPPPPLFLRPRPSNRVPHHRTSHNVLHPVIIHHSEITLQKRLSHSKRHLRLVLNNHGPHFLLTRYRHCPPPF